MLAFFIQESGLFSCYTFFAQSLYVIFPSLLGQCISVTYPTRTACRRVYVVGRKRTKVFNQNHQKSFNKRELIEEKFQIQKRAGEGYLNLIILRKSYGQLVWSQFIASLVHFIIDTPFIQGRQGNSQLDKFCEVKSSLIRTLSGCMFQQFCRRQQHRLHLHDFIYLQYCKSFKIKLKFILMIIQSQPWRRGGKRQSEWNIT